MEQDIVGLEVAVHDVVLRQNSEGVDDLGEVADGLGLGHYFLGGIPEALHHFLQGPSVAELVHEIVVVRCLQHVDVPDDVVLFLDLQQGVDLVQRALFQLRDVPELLSFDDFHCHFLFRLDIDSPEHFSVDALPYQLLQGVVFNNFPHPINNCCRPNSDIRSYTPISPPSFLPHPTQLAYSPP